MKIFESYPWPGNVRELENTIERIIAIEERETITESSLPEELLAPQGDQDRSYEIKPGFDLNETLDEISRTFIQQALQRTNGNLKETAGLLGINYRSLRYLIEKLGLKSVREEERRFS
jgi:DNA-binding NtrC family response regulator